jgi:hypothetical protein
MAAEELAVQTIYIASEFDPSLKTPLMNTARVIRISRPEQSPRRKLATTDFHHLTPHTGHR